MKEDSPSGVRIDKWLWAARFLKTRTLATQAVDGGKVRVNSARVKPAKEIKTGDSIEMRIGEVGWNVIVLGLSEKRGPASAAQLLYKETEESRAARELQRTQRRETADPGAGIRGRPTKRDRRRIERFGRDD